MPLVSHVPRAICHEQCTSSAERTQSNTLLLHTSGGAKWHTRGGGGPVRYVGCYVRRIALRQSYKCGSKHCRQQVVAEYKWCVVQHHATCPPPPMEGKSVVRVGGCCHYIHVTSTLHPHCSHQELLTSDVLQRYWCFGNSLNSNTKSVVTTHNSTDIFLCLRKCHFWASTHHTC